MSSVMFIPFDHTVALGEALNVGGAFIKESSHMTDPRKIIFQKSLASLGEGLLLLDMGDDSASGINLVLVVAFAHVSS